MNSDVGSRREVRDAVVVGSGPNGLAAAMILARAGLDVEVIEAEQSIGGGARTLDLGLAEGIEHDVCSAVHPMALASPFFRAMDLAARGVELAVPEVSYAHPLPGRPEGAVLAWRDLERTVQGLGADGPAWRHLFAPLVERAPQLVDLALDDHRRLPPSLRGPGGVLLAARFGTRVVQEGAGPPASRLTTEAGRALLAGLACHSFGPVPSPSTSAAALLLGTLGHAGGWPVPVGGSQAITDAIVTDLRAHGATLTTGRRVRTLADVPHARALLLDLPAGAAAQLLGARLPARRRRALRLFGRAAGAAAKVDLVVRGPIPWACPDIGRAGTVHLGGTAAQIGAAERDVARGRLPSAPVVLVSDPAQIDPSRARPAGPDGDLRPVWAYAHVPLDCPVDPTRLVLQQIERAAPGFTDTVVAARGIPAAQMAEHNPALLGGDIAMGSTSLWGMVARPRAAWDPYRLDGEGTYLCSAATPPGPGVHGMGGMHAARRALRQVFGIRDLPPLSPLPGP